jgi:DNA invertase Pin-like site-specific DNA recombinase
MKVAIYLRVSTGRQDTQNQLSDLTAYCDRMGYTQIHIYDDTVSGVNKNKPEWSRLMEDARLRQFDLLLFWALDRITREGALEMLQPLKTLDAYGVQWKSYTESYLDSTGPLKDAIIGLMATLASVERQKTIERTKAAIRRRRELGLPIGRPKRIFDREAVCRARAEGMTIKQVADKFKLSIGTVHRTLARRKQCQLICL